MSKFCAFFIGALILSSCSKEKNQIIPEDFKNYVDMFFEAGNSRGLNCNLKDIQLTIKFGVVESAHGKCKFRNNTIIIDENKWKLLTEEEKIWLIFHELGHCVLNRQHNNSKTNNDECISIMKGKEDGFDCSTNFYSTKWWNYYLDELFDPNTHLPNWYSRYEDYNSLSTTSTIAFYDTISDYFSIPNIDFSPYSNYSIDFEFNNWNTSQNVVKFYFGNIGFSDCDVCGGTNVRISSDSPQKIYYHNTSGSIRFNANVKLTIRKIESSLYFYVNERFVHTFEDSLWLGNSDVTTIQLNQPIQLKLTIDELE